MDTTVRKRGDGWYMNEIWVMNAKDTIKTCCTAHRAFQGVLELRDKACLDINVSVRRLDMIRWYMNMNEMWSTNSKDTIKTCCIAHFKGSLKCAIQRV